MSLLLRSDFEDVKHGFVDEKRVDGVDGNVVCVMQEEMLFVLCRRKCCLCYAGGNVVRVMQVEMLFVLCRWKCCLCYAGGNVCVMQVEMLLVLCRWKCSCYAGLERLFVS